MPVRCGIDAWVWPVHGNALPRCLVVWCHQLSCSTRKVIICYGRSMLQRRRTGPQPGPNLRSQQVLKVPQWLSQTSKVDDARISVAAGRRRRGAWLLGSTFMPPCAQQRGVVLVFITRACTCTKHLRWRRTEVSLPMLDRSQPPSRVGRAEEDAVEVEDEDEEKDGGEGCAGARSDVIAEH
jgi:hypothetical protein